MTGRWQSRTWRWAQCQWKPSWQRPIWWRTYNILASSASSLWLPRSQSTLSQSTWKMVGRNTVCVMDSSITTPTIKTRYDWVHQTIEPNLAPGYFHKINAHLKIKTKSFCICIIAFQFSLVNANMSKHASDEHHLHLCPLDWTPKTGCLRLKQRRRKYVS